MRFGIVLAAAAGLLPLACSDTAGKKAASPDAGDAGAAFVDGGVRAWTGGTEVRVAVPETGRAYVKLAPPSAATVGDPAGLDWDLAFEGYDVRTNGGISGSGKGASFGPVDYAAFFDEAPPFAPFMAADKAGGPFLEWYLYEGAPTHALYSRFHVFGVRDGARTWKVQILSYYGERDGAPVGALYKIRYAEVTAAGVGQAVEVAGLDGTAGGPAALDATPSECLDLATGARVMLTPSAARASGAWHLCFRRQSISVNGDLGGPRGAGAVDLDADATKVEARDAVMGRSPESERARFDAVTAAAFAGKAFRGDRVVSGFGDVWVDRSVLPARPAESVWLVQDAAGKKHLVGFDAFVGATERSPGTVVMFVRAVKE